MCVKCATENGGIVVAMVLVVELSLTTPENLLATMPTPIPVPTLVVRWRVQQVFGRDKQEMVAASPQNSIPLVAFEESS